jgi:hypothetical protein
MILAITRDDRRMGHDLITNLQITEAFSHTVQGLPNLAV